MLSTLPSFPNGTLALYNTKHSYGNVPMLRRYAKTLPHDTKIEIIATKICFCRRILTTCLKLTSMTIKEFLKMVAFLQLLTLILASICYSASAIFSYEIHIERLPIAMGIVFGCTIIAIPMRLVAEKWFDF